METTANPAKVDESILARIRHEFASKSQCIIKHSKPWTPWALVELLDIDDEDCPIPAELILYQAMGANSRKADHVGFAHAEVQQKFVNQTKAGEIHWRNGDPFPSRHERYMMEHAGSHKGQVSAGDMWDFVMSVHPSDLGRIHHYEKQYKKNGKLSRRMTTLCKSIMKKFPHMLIDIPGMCLHELCI